MQLTYLLVDFENLQPTADDVALVRGEQYRLWIFRGPHQNKFDAAIVEAWQPLGANVHFVQSSKAGKNALDFLVAFSLGQLTQQHAHSGYPEGDSPRFIVISKDGGFDALFDHVQSLGFIVSKAASISEALGLSANESTIEHRGGHATPAPDMKPRAPAPAKSPLPGKAAKPAKTPAKKAAKSPSLDDAFARVLDHLRAHPNNRPTTRKKLEKHLPSIVGGKMNADVMKALISKLESEGVVTDSGKELKYKIPRQKKTAS